MAASLWFSVRSFYILITIMLDDYMWFAFKNFIEVAQVIGYPVYEIMQIIAVVLYLRSKRAWLYSGREYPRFNRPVALAT